MYSSGGYIRPGEKAYEEEESFVFLAMFDRVVAE